MEQGTGVEPALTAWEAAVIPIYQPCEHWEYIISFMSFQGEIFMLYQILSYSLLNAVLDGTPNDKETLLKLAAERK